MIFNLQQIQDILTILERNTILYSVSILGTDILSEYDKQILSSFGIKIDKLSQETTTFEAMYHFGVLSQILGEKSSKNLKYSQFKKYLSTGKYIKMNDREKEMLQVAKQRTYSHIKGLGQKQKQTVEGIIYEEDQKSRAEYEKVIGDAIKTGIQDKKSLSNIMLEIGNKTGDWQRDLGRIVDTEYNNVFQEGRANQIEKQYGKDSLVYKDVYPGACRHCISAYLTEGIGSKPKLFKLSDLRANGSNIGRKVKDWVATLFGMHPWCFDKETDVLTNEGWKNWTNVTGQEMFLSMNPENGKVYWEKANKLIKYHYKGNFRHYKGFAYELMTTDTHIHFTKSKYGKYRLKFEDSFCKTELLVNTGNGWDGKNDEYFNIGGLKLKFEDYCELMGWWLSDGSISKLRNGKTYQLKITQEKKQNRPIVEKILKKCFGRVWVGNGAFYVNIHDEVADYFRQFGHSYNKYIPDIIKNAKIECIDIFMEAFCRGDGNKRVKQNNKIKSKEVVYNSTSSPKLSSDLGELIIKQ